MPLSDKVQQLIYRLNNSSIAEVQAYFDKLNDKQIAALLQEVFQQESDDINLALDANPLLSNQLANLTASALKLRLSGGQARELAVNFLNFTTSRGRLGEPHYWVLRCLGDSLEIVQESQPHVAYWLAHALDKPNAELQALASSLSKTRMGELARLACEIFSAPEEAGVAQFVNQYKGANAFDTLVRNLIVLTGGDHWIEQSQGPMHNSHMDLLMAELVYLAPDEAVREKALATAMKHLLCNSKAFTNSRRHAQSFYCLAVAMFEHTQHTTWPPAALNKISDFVQRVAPLKEFVYPNLMDYQIANLLLKSLNQTKCPQQLTQLTELATKFCKHMSGPLFEDLVTLLQNAGINVPTRATRALQTRPSRKMPQFLRDVSGVVPAHTVIRHRDSSIVRRQTRQLAHAPF